MESTGLEVLEGRRISIEGVVQGVGFRPWVYRVAQSSGVQGRVHNDSAGVIIEAFGRHAALDAFVANLKATPPPAAKIRTLAWETIPPEPATGFVIVASSVSEERNVSIPPDLATCEECLEEIFDPGSRRYRYPFTNCTNCGPRFTISRDVPYDRPATTMAGFTMCPACQREYDSVADRRFHAQPNACPVCGPTLKLVDPTGRDPWARGEGDDLHRAANAILGGRILALKGLGGFHLACRADDSKLVAKLRARKKRDEKPFAVMVRTMAEAEALAELSEAERELLAATERPVVLVRRRPSTAVCEEVAPENPMLGLMLAYTPLHHLLLADVKLPLVMTSANLSDEPIVCRNGEAADRLQGIADLFLFHDREIETRCDDSVARVIAGRPVLFRRSRGWVPRSITVVRPFAVPVLATGAQMKNTFCIGAGRHAFLGPHVGDLSGAETFSSFEESSSRFLKFLRVQPAVIAHDLHPGYASTEWAMEQESRSSRVIGVQHHHAHVASAMAEHGLAGPVLGLAFDGTGYGTDGQAWGGEFLLADYESYRRFATFRAIPLAGGERAIRDVWRLSLAVLDDALGAGAWSLEDFPVFSDLPAAHVSVVRRMIEHRVNTPLAHGLGRWFDAFAALSLERPRATYEGQLAMAWDFVADPGRSRSYGFEIDDSRDPWEVDLRPAVTAAAREIRVGVAAPIISAKFHETIIHAAAEVAGRVLRVVGRVPVVLTGGCFQNARLAEGLAGDLSAQTRVYLHEGVPPGDGGIALGQAVVASAIADREG